MYNLFNNKTIYNNGCGTINISCTAAILCIRFSFSSFSVLLRCAARERLKNPAEILRWIKPAFNRYINYRHRRIGKLIACVSQLNAVYIIHHRYSKLTPEHSAHMAFGYVACTRRFVKRTYILVDNTKPTAEVEYVIELNAGGTVAAVTPTVKFQGYTLSYGKNTDPVANSSLNELTLNTKGRKRRNSKGIRRRWRRNDCYLRSYNNRSRQ